MSKTMVKATDIKNGDSFDYDDFAGLGDMQRDELDRDLRSRDLCRIDHGNGYIIGWYYAEDGSRLDDPVIAEEQPATAWL